MASPVQDLPDVWLKPTHKLLAALQPLEAPQEKQLGAV